jgi:hypothetical protein
MGAVLGTSLSADFSELEVEVVVSHPCGIASIGGHIRTVTYEEIEPGVVQRELAIFMHNDAPVGDAKEFACPSNQKIRFHTLKFATAGLIGIRFLARIKVASCCDVPPTDTSVCWLHSSEKFII